jgi:hypothetical protein
MLTATVKYFSINRVLRIGILCVLHKGALQQSQIKIVQDDFTKRLDKHQTTPKGTNSNLTNFST